MSSICGFFYTDGKPASSNTINGMVKALNHWQADDTGIWHNGSVALGHLMLYTTPESLHEKLPLYYPEPGLSITADARIDNREELFEELDIPDSERAEIPDSMLILKAYRKWGIDTPQKLLGDFVFVIWDEQNRHFFCARDHMGIKPFYYYNNNNIFAFASEMKGIHSIEGVNKTVDEQWIADFLCMIYPDRTGTLYENIYRLEGAHALIVTHDNIKKIKYWRPDPARRLSPKSDEDYIAGFREKLFNSIKARLRSNYPVASKLTGGLDSVAISSIAHRLLENHGNGLTTFSDVFPGCPLPPSISIRTDEKADILSVVKYTGIKNFFFVNEHEKGFFDTLNDALKFHDEPPKEFINIYYDMLYEQANEKGMRILLSGYGGDEVVSSFGAGYQEELLYQGKLQTLWDEIKGSAKGTNSNRFFLFLKLILREALETFGVDIKRINWQKNGFKRKTARKFESRDLDPEMSTRLKMRKRHFRYNLSLLFKGNVNERLVQCISSPERFAPRLEYCAIAATARRLEYRYPLLDIPLIEYYMALPSNLKRHNGYGRYIFRKAIGGIVPDNIRWRKEKSLAAGSSPSSMFRLHRDMGQMIRVLEEFPKESIIHEYLDVQKRIERNKKAIKEKNIRGWNVGRIYLLERKLRALF